MAGRDGWIPKVHRIGYSQVTGVPESTLAPGSTSSTTSATSRPRCRRCTPPTRCSSCCSASPLGRARRDLRDPLRDRHVVHDRVLRRALRLGRADRLRVRRRSATSLRRPLVAALAARRAVPASAVAARAERPREADRCTAKQSRVRRDGRAAHRDAHRCQRAPERRGTLADISVRCPLCGADDYHVRFDDRLERRTIDPQRALHVDVERVRRARPDRRVPLAAPRLHEPAPAPPEGAGHVRRGRGHALPGGGAGSRRDLHREPRARAARSCRPAGCSTSAATSARSSSSPSSAGFEVAGVEPSRWAAEIARGRIARHGHLRRRRGCADARRTRYDVDHDLGRDRAPARSGARPARHLRVRCGPGGIFAISTMDVDALFPRVAGRRWPWYMQMHLVYFSRRTLCEMLRREGFQIVDVRSHTARGARSRTSSRGSTPTAARPIAPRSALTRATRLDERTVGVNLGDIFTVVARKPLALGGHHERRRPRRDHGAPGRAAASRRRIAAVASRGACGRSTATRCSSSRSRAS